MVCTIFAQTNDYKVDALVKPRTQETVITVGEQDGDVQGLTNKAVQMAIDALPKEGGAVKLSPGTFEIIAPIKVVSNMKLIGSGPETILKIADGVSTQFLVDPDYGELMVTVKDPTGFKTGMAIQIVDDESRKCWDVSTAILTDIKEYVLYFDTYLIRDYHADQNGIISNATSGVAAVQVENVVISNFTVDGNKEKSAPMDGCNGAGVYVFKSENVIVENVHVKNFNGEGISWQITENVTVRNCEINDCANIGLHPGTGSPNSLIENNNSHHNAMDGLFVCWRMRHSLVKGNLFHHNGRYGICTGHKDTDVVFEGNHIYENNSHGVNFRRESAANAPHRNTFTKNILENNGVVSGGYGFYIDSPAQNLVLKNNIIRDTGNGTQKAAVFISKNGLPVKMSDNKMSGHSDGDVVHAK
jgi:hypothetical protein